MEIIFKQDNVKSVSYTEIHLIAFKKAGVFAHLPDSTRIIDIFDMDLGDNASLRKYAITGAKASFRLSGDGELPNFARIIQEQKEVEVDLGVVEEYFTQRTLGEY